MSVLATSDVANPVAQETYHILNESNIARDYYLDYLADF